MKKLYVIIGYNNIDEWHKGNMSEIDSSSVRLIEFENQRDKHMFIDGMRILDSSLGSLSGNFFIISEDEYINYKNKINE